MFSPMDLDQDVNSDNWIHVLFSSLFGKVNVFKLLIGVKLEMNIIHSKGCLHEIQENV